MLLGISYVMAPSGGAPRAQRTPTRRGKAPSAATRALWEPVPSTAWQQPIRASAVVLRCSVLHKLKQYVVLSFDVLQTR